MEQPIVAKPTAPTMEEPSTTGPTSPSGGLHDEGDPSVEEAWDAMETWSGPTKVGTEPYEGRTEQCSTRSTHG